MYFHFCGVIVCHVLFSHQNLTKYMYMYNVNASVTFKVVSRSSSRNGRKLLKSERYTLACSSCLMYYNRNTFLLTSDFLPNISLVVGHWQLTYLSLALRTHDISTTTNLQTSDRKARDNCPQNQRYQCYQESIS